MCVEDDRVLDYVVALFCNENVGAVTISIGLVYLNTR